MCGVTASSPNTVNLRCPSRIDDDSQRHPAKTWYKNNTILSFHNAAHSRYRITNLRWPLLSPRGIARERWGSRALLYRAELEVLKTRLRGAYGVGGSKRTSVGVAICCDLFLFDAGGANERLPWPSAIGREFQLNPK